ncbi:MAG TPA: hypothetical protein VNO43_13885 [Candidatus Eisenbacteria bacterium]|nr:hypothetical protein [Candidatus Eisenbacteria bacterium]
MEGNPEDFEAIGNRLGFTVAEENGRILKLAWRGPRFPAFLCLGIATGLILISVPIVEAIRLRGFTGPAGSLWYFPVMNAVLFVISLYLISMRRLLLLDSGARRVTLVRSSLFRKRRLVAAFDEIRRVVIGIDRVYSGFAVAGSSAAERFPVPSLRLELVDGRTVLIDRGGLRRLKSLAEKLSARLERPLKIEPALSQP